MNDAATHDGSPLDSDQLIDYLRYCAATIDFAGDQLSRIRPTSSPTETANVAEFSIAHLSFAYRILKDLVGVHCAHCSRRMGEYTDGRAISAHVKFLEGSRYAHISHPDPQHEHNRPRELATLTTRNGTKKRIVLSAPGFMDAFTIPEPEEA